MPGFTAGQPPRGTHPEPTRAELRVRLRHVACRSQSKPKILDALVAGVTSTEAIAVHLDIHPETVKRHFSQLFDRTGIHDRLFVAVLWAEVRREDQMGEPLEGER